MNVIISPVIEDAINMAHRVQNEIIRLTRVQSELLSPIANEALEVNNIEYLEKLISLFPNSIERMDMDVRLHTLKV